MITNFRIMRCDINMDPDMEPYPVYTDNNDTDSELGTNYDRYLGLNSLNKNWFWSGTTREMARKFRYFHDDYYSFYCIIYTQVFKCTLLYP